MDHNQNVYFKDTIKKKVSLIIFQCESNNKNNVEGNIPQNKLEENIPESKLDGNIPENKLEENIPESKLDGNIPENKLEENIPAQTGAYVFFLFYFYI